MNGEESKTRPSDKPASSPSPGSDKGKAPKKRRWRTPLIVIGAIIFVFVIIPKAFHAWHTVSTDDAYVNSYVTFVAPRVSGQVVRVLVDDNNRVKNGDVLVELDPEPYRVQVAIKQAAVDSGQAELVVAQATIRRLTEGVTDFSFILAGLGANLGLLPTEGLNMIVTGALISITVNPAVFSAAIALAGGREEPATKA